MQSWNAPDASALTCRGTPCWGRRGRARRRDLGVLPLDVVYRRGAEAAPLMSPVRTAAIVVLKVPGEHRQSLCV